MLAVFRQEISSFFSSAIGYLVIAVFIITNGLMLWVFRGSFNILDYGFADLSLFFLWAPLLFILIVPAITMRSFSDDLKSGTIEILKIKPISSWKLTLGKFFGCWMLLLLILLPTLLYPMAIESMSMQSLDWGVVASSYIGLFLLVGSYSALGIWTSSLTSSQIIAFITAAVGTWFFYLGFQGLGTLFYGEEALIIGRWGMQARYEGFSRGIVDLSDLVYFISIIAFFLFLAQFQIGKKR